MLLDLGEEAAMTASCPPVMVARACEVVMVGTGGGRDEEVGRTD